MLCAPARDCLGGPAPDSLQCAHAFLVLGIPNWTQHLRVPGLNRNIEVWKQHWFQLKICSRWSRLSSLQKVKMVDSNFHCTFLIFILHTKASYLTADNSVGKDGHHWIFFFTYGIPNGPKNLKDENSVYWHLQSLHLAHHISSQTIFTWVDTLWEPQPD